MARVMVVEDEGIVAQDIAQILRSLGHDVVAIAKTGPEAIAQFDETAPDLLLMDVRLVGPMDGIDAAAAIRAKRDVPILFLTAFADMETVDRARQIQPYAYVLKPFTDRDISSAITVALHKHRIDLEVRERERWLSTTLHTIGDGVIATDANGKITLLNGTAERLIGWKQSEVLGRDAQEVVILVDAEDPSNPAHEPHEHPVRRALHGRAPVRLERNALLVSRSGAKVGVDASSAPICDAAGKVLGVVVVLRDREERNKLEAPFAMPDRVAALGVMTAGVAHELNNPLAYTTANLSILLEELPSLKADVEKHVITPTSPGWTEVARHFTLIEQALKDANEGASRLGRIVTDLKAFSDPPDHAAATVELPPLLVTAVRMANNEIRHRADFFQDIFSAPPVLGNAAQLIQIVYHLLINAAQSMPEGNPSDQEIRLRLSTDGDGYAVIEVKDSGSGIPPEVMVRIFDPFFSTKPPDQARGLGLSICQTLVQAHGGELTVESEPGKGSLFRVRLPPSARPVIAEPIPIQRAKPPAHSIGGARVLVVDDEPLVGVALRRTLGPSHDVTLATSSDQALGFLRGGASFDVIFCDLLMPDVSGMDLYEQMRTEHPLQAERAIFLTGGAFTPRSQKFLHEHADRTVLKPFDPESIRKLVQSKLVHAAHD